MLDAKEIRLCLRDGSLDGIIEAIVPGWEGKVFWLPRNRAEELSQPNKIAHPYVYLLLGEEEETTGETKLYLYIGETDNPGERSRRIVRHLPKKDWVERIFIVTCTDECDWFNKAVVMYLEHRMLELARAASRDNSIALQNKQDPIQPNISEKYRSRYEEFLKEAIIVLEVLYERGIFTTPKPVETDSAAEQATSATQSPLFVCRAGKVDAQMRVVNGQFVVLKGALVSKPEKDKYPNTRRRQEELQDAGILAKVPNEPEMLRLNQDYPFKSPAVAGRIICGWQSGPKVWRVYEEGKEYEQMQTYSDWLAAQDS